MTKEEFEQAINEASFQVAKTMPKIPHEYSVKKNWSDKNKFEDVAQFIIENGYKQNFFTRTYTYFDYNGYQYWTIDIILNRAKINVEL